MSFNRIFIFLMIFSFNTSSFAKNDSKFSDEPWYTSIEINDLLDLSKQYKNKCKDSKVSLTCDAIKNKISALFQHSDLNDASITFVVDEIYSNTLNNNNLHEMEDRELVKTLLTSATIGKENSLNRIFNDSGYQNKINKAMELQKTYTPLHLAQYDVKAEYLASKELHKLYTFSVCGLRHNMMAMGDYSSNLSYIPCLNQYDNAYLKIISNTNYLLKNLL